VTEASHGRRVRGDVLVSQSTTGHTRRRRAASEEHGHVWGEPPHRGHPPRGLRIALDRRSSTTPDLIAPRPLAPLGFEAEL